MMIGSKSNRFGANFEALRNNPGRFGATRNDEKHSKRLGANRNDSFGMLRSKFGRSEHLTRMFPDLYGCNETVLNRMTPSENVALVTRALLQWMEKRQHDQARVIMDVHNHWTGMFPDLYGRNETVLKANDSKRECFIGNLGLLPNLHGRNATVSDPPNQKRGPFRIH
jgi:hypothetical protein